MNNNNLKNNILKPLFLNILSNYKKKTLMKKSYNKNEYKKKKRKRKI